MDIQNIWRKFCFIRSIHYYYSVNMSNKQYLYALSISGVAMKKGRMIWATENYIN